MLKKSTKTGCCPGEHISKSEQLILETAGDDKRNKWFYVFVLQILCHFSTLFFFLPVYTKSIPRFTSGSHGTKFIDKYISFGLHFALKNSISKACIDHVLCI